MEKLTVASALERLGKLGSEYLKNIERADFDVGLYKPDELDKQQPHTRDELYVIASGSGSFEQGGEVLPVEVGDVIFVPAGAAHCFVNFSRDFSTWAVFFGPPTD